MKSRDGIEMVECPPIDRDNIEIDKSKYYFLIRVNFRHGIIEVAVCHPEKGSASKISAVDDPTCDRREGVDVNSLANIYMIYYGRCAQDIYLVILNKGFVQSYTHAAYLGKELKKAELALALGIQKFYQE